MSHVLVAVVVLSIALGAAQVTFRNYTARTQMARLSSQAGAIQRIVMRPFFSGEIPQNNAISDIQLLQGAFSDRVYVYDQLGNVVLQAQYGRVPSVVPSPAAQVQVLRFGQNYRAMENGVGIVGVPVWLGPGNIAGGLFLESPLASSNPTASSLSRLLLLDLLAAIVLVGVLAYVISGRLLGPLQHLRQVVAGSGRTPEGQNHRASEDQGPWEVQALAHEFNRLQDRIEGQMDQLHREAEARDALMAHVAHDLRTPLTSIRGFLEAVRDGVAVGPTHDRAVDVAWEETLRLQRLVDRLLKATRIRSEGGTLAILSTRQWVAKTLERVGPLLERHHLELRWDVRQEANIRGNEDYLMEALLNVLDNAIKWSPSGAIIEVGSELRDNRVVVWVKDQGPGIAEELLPRVFERFVTGDSSRQHSSGLGLFIVDEVARQHQGEVIIHSKPGMGTTVELWLPLAELP